MVQFVERLPGKHEDSISITSTAKLGVAMAAAPELGCKPSAGEVEIGLGLAGLPRLLG